MSTPPAPQTTPHEPATSRSRTPASRTAEAADRHWSALRHGPSWLRFLGVAAAGLALDLGTKYWAFHALGQGSAPRVVIPHVLEFQTMLNNGALFGIGSGQTALFLVASVFALVLVVWMFAQTNPRRRLLQIALGAILAGALGNMYDRVFVKLLEQPWPLGNGRSAYMVVTGEAPRVLDVQAYPPEPGKTTYVVPRNEAPRQVGFVRDFIKIPTRWFGGREVWPWVFNVADMLLVGGVAILAVHLWLDRRRPARERRAGSEAVGPGAANGD